MRRFSLKHAFADANPPYRIPAFSLTESEWRTGGIGCLLVIRTPDTTASDELNEDFCRRIQCMTLVSVLPKEALQEVWECLVSAWNYYQNPAVRARRSRRRLLSSSSLGRATSGRLFL